MKSSKIAAAFLALSVSTAAMAQTMDSSTTNASNSATSQTGSSDTMGSMSGSNSMATTSQGSMPSANSQPLPASGSAPNRTNSDFGTLAPGMADTNPGQNAPSTTRAASSTETRAPLRGANSFTEKQAMRRLQKAGYTQITGLAKDDQSVWRGTAQKGDQNVAVALDYRGRITQQPTQQ